MKLLQQQKHLKTAFVVPTPSFRETVKKIMILLLLIKLIGYKEENI